MGKILESDSFLDRGSGQVCKGVGIDKKGGNVFERFKCMKCQGFGQARPIYSFGGLIPIAEAASMREWLVVDEPATYSDGNCKFLLRSALGCCSC